MNKIDKLFKWWGIGFTSVFLIYWWKAIAVMTVFTLIGFLIERIIKNISKKSKYKKTNK